MEFEWEIPFSTPIGFKHPDKPEETPKPAEKPEPGSQKPSAGEKKAEPVRVDINLEGLAARISEVAVPAGNYRALTATEKRLCWLDENPGKPDEAPLQCLDIANKGEKPTTILEGVQSYQMSGDGKKFLVRKQNDYYVFDSDVTEAALKTPKTMTDAKVDLKDWTFAVKPAEEYRELFLDTWRLHRDYFYDPKMHGIDWPAVKEKYLPLVERVRDREELSDLIAEMVSELSALHTMVGGGDVRRGQDQVQIAALGARLERDTAARGYLVKHIYKSTRTVRTNGRLWCGPV